MPARKTKADMMAFMRELIREEPDGPRKILFAFDLDDTLIKSDSSIVVRNNRTVKKLSPAEYAVYEPKPGDELDFIEFKRIINPEVIKTTFELFTKVLTASNRIQNAKTIILTARSPIIAKDLNLFLKNKGLTGVELFAVNSSDAQAKADVIQTFIDQGYNTIRFYDDAPKNIAAVKALGATNPKADIMTKLVKHEVKESVDRIPGGIAQGKTIMDLVKKMDPKGYYFNERLRKVLSDELELGIKVEMEHTTDRKIAKEIALDHMFEDPRYYTKLKRAKLEEEVTENVHEPMNPGILKKRLGKLSCSKVREERARLKDKGTTYAKALQRYLNYQDC